MRSKIKLINKVLGFAGIAVLTAIGFACNFEKDLDLDLDGNKELFVEAYLEPDQPGRLLLTTTTGYFDSLNIPLIQRATATISVNGATQAFTNQTYIDFKASKLYNYLSPALPLRDGQTVELSISDSLGRHLTGRSYVMQEVPIDSVKVVFSQQGDSSAYLSVWFTDPANQSDYYRLIVNKDSLQAPASGGGLLQDNSRDGKAIAMRTGYNFKPQDKVYLRLYHLEKAYYAYLTSVSDAQGSNGNPFAQPASVKSTVTGGKGVFTVLRYDFDSLQIPNP